MFAHAKVNITGLHSQTLLYFACHK